MNDHVSFRLGDSIPYATLCDVIGVQFVWLSHGCSLAFRDKVVLRGVECCLWDMCTTGRRLACAQPACGPRSTNSWSPLIVGDAAKEEKPGPLQLIDGAQQATWIREVDIWHFRISVRGGEQSGCRWPYCTVVEEREMGVRAGPWQEPEMSTRQTRGNQTLTFTHLHVPATSYLILLPLYDTRTREPRLS